MAEKRDFTIFNVRAVSGPDNDDRAGNLTFRVYDNQLERAFVLKASFTGDGNLNQPPSSQLLELAPQIDLRASEADCAGPFGEDIFEIFKKVVKQARERAEQLAEEGGESGE